MHGSLSDEKTLNAGSGGAGENYMHLGIPPVNRIHFLNIDSGF
jgi:hypothetical protein